MTATSPLPDRPDRLGDDAVEKGAHEGRRLYETVWLDLNRSSDVLPVDPVRMASELGVDVFVTELEDSVSGALVKRPGSDPVIMIHKDDSKGRQRFTCAHELGHFVDRGGEEEFTYVDQRQRRDSGNGAGRPDEAFADAFAEELLMPKHLVRALRDDGFELVTLAHQFDVPSDTMRYRLHNLGLEIRD